MTELQIFWLGAAAILTLYAQYVGRLYLRRAALLRRAVRSSGTVSEIALHRGEDGPDVFTPTVSFRDRQGRNYRVSMASTTDVGKFRVGQSVAIQYEAGNPANAVLAGTRWAGVRAHAVALGLLAAFALFLYVKVELNRPSR